MMNDIWIQSCLLWAVLMAACTLTRSYDKNVEYMRAGVVGKPLLCFQYMTMVAFTNVVLYSLLHLTKGQFNHYLIELSVWATYAPFTGISAASVLLLSVERPRLPDFKPGTYSADIHVYTLKEKS